MGRFTKIVSFLVLLNVLGKCLSDPYPGKFSGHDHEHGHGWVKMHSNQHHDASSKLSEAYVKFHGLGDGASKGGSGGGKGGFLGGLLNKFGGGSSQEQGGNGGWSSGQELMSVQMGSGGGGWGSSQMMAQASSMGGWGGGESAAKPTGWASPGGGMQVMQTQTMQKPKGWQSGQFSKFRPGNSGSNDKGHFNFELPHGKPAFIQRLKPILDLPKFGWGGWGK